MTIHHSLSVTVTLHWDAYQFDVIADLLGRAKEDPAKLNAVTAGLKASESALSDAVASNTPQP